MEFPTAHREASREGNPGSTALTAPCSAAIIRVLMTFFVAFPRGVHAARCEEGLLDGRTRVRFPKESSMREPRLSPRGPCWGVVFPMVYREAKGEGTPDRRPSLRPVPLSLFVL